jgi:hypothetical protein
MKPFDLGFIPEVLPTDKNIARLIFDKHKEYYVKSKAYSVLYYATRLIGGLCAGALPFIIPHSNLNWLATTLSASIVALTVIDLVFNPKDNWALYSKATDLIVIGQIQANDPDGYEKNKKILSVLLNTENGKLAKLVDLDELLHSIQSTQKELPKKGTTVKQPKG